ncbi:MAG: hypothetical protein WDZ62_01785 [Candidatus Pacearchaeota archaeon]
MKRIKLSLTIFLGIFLLGVLLIINLNLVNAELESFYCAERTLDGAWCQNVPLDEVDEDYDYLPTSCDSTDFCRTGTCVNPNEGACRPNVPQRVCEADGGVWDERPREEINRCQLGCCYIGSGASFVTQTKCSSLSGEYGIEIEEFNPNIKNSGQCLASAFPEDEGACTSDDGFVTSCEMLTSERCESRISSSGEDVIVEFHRGELCTSPRLDTICSPTERTTLVDNKDGVFFLDSCGNVANIYDATRQDDPTYWETIISEGDSCSLDNDLSNSNACGNCNVFDGSIGKIYDRNNNQMFPNPPIMGNYMCADLSCKSGKFAEDFRDRFGRWAQQGESWCGNTALQGFENTPGSEHSRFECSFGEVEAESGDPFRQTICSETEFVIEGQEEGFKTGNFRPNRWHDCTITTTQEDCEDIQSRDCEWVEGETLGLLHVDDDGLKLVVNEDGELVSRDQTNSKTGAACIPKYPVGTFFWEPETRKEILQGESSGQLCMIGGDFCVARFERTRIAGILGEDFKCVENCDCVGLDEGDSRPGRTSAENSIFNSDWFEHRNDMCVALGDCGLIENYIGEQGRWSEDDLVQYNRDIDENFEPEFEGDEE